MIAKLRKPWHARPFVALSIQLTDGRVLDVPHPDFIYISPTGARMFITDAEDKRAACRSVWAADFAVSSASRPLTALNSSKPNPMVTRQ